MAQTKRKKTKENEEIRANIVDALQLIQDAGFLRYVWALCLLQLGWLPTE